MPLQSKDSDWLTVTKQKTGIMQQEENQTPTANNTQPIFPDSTVLQSSFSFPTAFQKKLSFYGSLKA